MSIFKSSRVKFYRATLTNKVNGYRPNRYLSGVDIRSELLGSGNVDLSGFQSEYANRLLWGVSKSDEVGGNFYSVTVALSRLIAMYALDESFRAEFREHPEQFAIVNSEYLVDAKDLFIFTEGSDHKLYAYKGNEHKVEEGHLIAQSLDPATEKVKVVRFSEISNLMSEILTDARPDSSMRLIDDLYATAGFPDVSQKTYECVLLEDDGENRKWRRVIDALNIAYRDCVARIAETGEQISKEQLIDVTARGIASYLSLTRFSPELLELDQYRHEMRTSELKSINIQPEIDLIDDNSDEIKPELRETAIS